MTYDKEKRHQYYVDHCVKEREYYRNWYRKNKHRKKLYNDEYNPPEIKRQYIKVENPPYFNRKKIKITVNDTDAMININLSKFNESDISKITTLIKDLITNGRQEE